MRGVLGSLILSILIGNASSLADPPVVRQGGVVKDGVSLGGENSGGGDLELFDENKHTAVIRQLVYTAIEDILLDLRTLVLELPDVTFNAVKEKKDQLVWIPKGPTEIPLEGLRVPGIDRPVTMRISKISETKFHVEVDSKRLYERVFHQHEKDGSFKRFPDGRFVPISLVERSIQVRALVFHELMRALGIETKPLDYEHTSLYEAEVRPYFTYIDSQEKLDFLRRLQRMHIDQQYHAPDSARALNPADPTHVTHPCGLIMVVNFGDLRNGPNVSTTSSYINTFVWNPFRDPTHTGGVYEQSGMECRRLGKIATYSCDLNSYWRSKSNIICTGVNPEVGDAKRHFDTKCNLRPPKNWRVSADTSIERVCWEVEIDPKTKVVRDSQRSLSEPFFDNTLVTYFSNRALEAPIKKHGILLLPKDGQTNGALEFQWK